MLYVVDNVLLVCCTERVEQLLFVNSRLTDLLQKLLVAFINVLFTADLPAKFADKWYTREHEPEAAGFFGRMNSHLVLQYSICFGGWGKGNLRPTVLPNLVSSRYGQLLL